MKNAFSILLFLILMFNDIFADDKEVEEDKKEESPSVSVLVVCLVACSSAALFSGQTLIWSFSERIGVTLGLSMEQIGWILGFCGLSGLVGATIPTWLGTKYGRILPLVLGLLGSEVLAQVPSGQIVHDAEYYVLEAHHVEATFPSQACRHRR